MTFILDMSGSVGQINFDRVRNFTISAVRDLEIDNGFFRISVVTFRSVAWVRGRVSEWVNGWMGGWVNG